MSGVQAAALGSVFCVTCHDHSSRTVPSCLHLKKSLIPIQRITDKEGSLNWIFLSIITSESHFMIKFEFFPTWPVARSYMFSERILEEQTTVSKVPEQRQQAPAFFQLKCSLI